MEEKAAAVRKQLVAERKRVLEDIGKRAGYLSEAAQGDLNARLRELADGISGKVQKERQPPRKK